MYWWLWFAVPVVCALVTPSAAALWKRVARPVGPSVMHTLVAVLALEVLVVGAWVYFGILVVEVWLAARGPSWALLVVSVYFLLIPVAISVSAAAGVLIAHTNRIEWHRNTVEGSHRKGWVEGYFAVVTVMVVAQTGMAGIFSDFIESGEALLRPDVELAGVFDYEQFLTPQWGEWVAQEVVLSVFLWIVASQWFRLLVRWLQFRWDLGSGLGRWLPGLSRRSRVYTLLLFPALLMLSASLFFKIFIAGATLRVAQLAIGWVWRANPIAVLSPLSWPRRGRHWFRRRRSAPTMVVVSDRRRPIALTSESNSAFAGNGDVKGCKQVFLVLAGAFVFRIILAGTILRFALLLFGLVLIMQLNETTLTRKRVGQRRKDRG